MSNTHGIADFAHELQAVCADQLPACVISGGSPTVPTPPSLTLAAFATEAYVRETDTLVYADQEAHSVTLTGADGTYWLAISTDTWTSYAQWTTENGTKYRWRPSATQPADVVGLLTFASVTVAGGAITAVTPLASVTRAAAGRALLGLGTMATQNANAVNISGGTATLGTLEVTGPTGLGVAPDGAYFLRTGPGAVRMGGPMQCDDVVGIGVAPNPGYGVTTTLNGYFGGSVYVASNVGVVTSIGAPFSFSLQIGGSGTAGKLGGGPWSDTSSRTLKTAIVPLTEALALCRRLQPRTFRWTEPDHAAALPGTQIGFIAEEVEPVLPQWVGRTPQGEPTLCPLGFEALAIAAIQELSALLEALTARVAALEARPA